MEVLVHALTFVLSAAVIWFFAGLLIDAVYRVARRFHKSGFTVAFFILGFLTSISEISVAVNSAIEGVPQVSVGNLAGASFVLVLFLVPLLAVASRGMKLRHTLSKRNLQLALAIILLPVLFVMDGGVSRNEGLLLIVAYVTLLFAIKGQKDSLKKDVAMIEADLLPEGRRTTLGDAAKILTGGAFIFVAGHFLVQQAVYFAGLWSVPRSLVGLMLLSIGTNVPEIVIAVRSMLKRRQEIAVGDYIGSAATNTFIFGALAAATGPFRVESSEFIATAVLMLGGLICFYLFARSRQEISRREGCILLAFYAAFLAVQVFNMVRFGAD